MIRLLPWVVSLSGLTLIIAGVAMIYFPAAVVLAGCAVLGIGAFLIDVPE